MKNDKEFLESIYKKKALQSAKRKKTILLTLVAVIVVGFTAVAAFLANVNDDATDNKTISNDNVVALPDYSEENSADASEETKDDTVSTDESADGVIASDSSTEKVLLLTCPSNDSTDENITVTPLSDNFSISTHYDSDVFYDTLQEYKNNDARFYVALTIDPVTTFTYEGKYLSEIFVTSNGYHLFIDDAHKEFNDFIIGYRKWRYSDAHYSIYSKLESAADAGDDDAAQMLLEYTKTDDSVLYYNLVWKNDKTPEYIAKFMVQCDEYQAIWTEYNENGVTILNSAYQAEADRLVADGYELKCTTSGEVTRLVGTLTSEQILDFNDNERFSYSCAWLESAKEDGTYTYYTPFAEHDE